VISEKIQLFCSTDNYLQIPPVFNKWKTKQLALLYKAVVCFSVGPPKRRILNILAKSLSKQTANIGQVSVALLANEPLFTSKKINICLFYSKR